MSLLLEALNRLESERKQKSIRYDMAHASTSLPDGMIPIDNCFAPRERHSEEITIINNGSNGSWLIVILLFNALLLGVIVVFWTQYQNYKNNNDALLYSYLLKQYPAPLVQSVNDNDKPTDLARQVVMEAETELAKLGADKKQSIMTSNTIDQDSIKTTAKKNQLASAQNHADEQQNEHPAKAYKSNETKADTTSSEAQISYDNDEVYWLSNLPVNLASQFPQLTYNAHLYSPDLPSARMVMVNDKQYSEKDYLQKDLQIDQITPEGVIYKFRQVKLNVNVLSELQ